MTAVPTPIHPGAVGEAPARDGGAERGDGHGHPQAEAMGHAQGHAHTHAHAHGHGHGHGHHPGHAHAHAHVHAPGPGAPGAGHGSLAPAEGTAAVTLHDLTIAYRGHPAVHHLSGFFAAGCLTAVVGPNGAGKSSLLGVLSGANRQFEGSVQRDPALRLAYLPQASALDRSFPVQVQDAVATGLWARCGSLKAVGPADRSRIGEALAAVGLSGFERRWLNELSVGQAQRVLFARVLLQDAGLILLDEPFNAIDGRTTADLLGLLARWRQERRTVIAVLHDLEQVRAHFDQALLLAREPVAWGPTAQVLRAEHLFRARQMAEAWDEAAPDCRGPASAPARAA